MPKLTIHRGDLQWEIHFEGQARLSDVLVDNGFGISHPCGGRGSCGKCAVDLSGAVSAPDEMERRAGARLSCRAILLGDAEAVLPEERMPVQIETFGARAVLKAPLGESLGAAVDVGTTTIALKLFDLNDGACLAEAAMGNPQAGVAADVMGRIGAALDGKLDLLRQQVTQALRQLLDEACARAGRRFDEVDSMVVAGNTTMLYLLTGRNPESLSRAPFEADCLFDETIELLGKRAYLPPCMNAFVGADISCAVLSAGQCRGETSLLADIGTNGEIALWRNGTLFVSSTAAGPAFEGAGISCGCGSIPGAIDRVWLENGNAAVHTIGGEVPVGVCGSGLIDAVACFLENGMVDETGAAEADALPLGGVNLLPRDIRAVQLAKAAVAAGIGTLVESAGVSLDQIQTFFIAGGFGNHLDIQSAVRIGLIPTKLGSKAKSLGNAALAGAAQLLLDRDRIAEIRRIAACSKHIALGGNPAFNERYMEEMLFPEESYKM